MKELRDLVKFIQENKLFTTFGITQEEWLNLCQGKANANILNRFVPGFIKHMDEIPGDFAAQIKGRVPEVLLKQLSVPDEAFWQMTIDRNLLGSMLKTSPEERQEIIAAAKAAIPEIETLTERAKTYPKFASMKAGSVVEGIAGERKSPLADAFRGLGDLLKKGKRDPNTPDGSGHGKS